MNLMNVYDKFPVFAQNMAFSYMGGRIQRTRFGEGFRKRLAEFESHDEWSRDQLVAWRNERLHEIVAHCYETVPYYRSVMDEGGIDPASIKDDESLKALPVITKADVKANPSAFVSSRAKDMNIIHVHTSGTTGSGFQFDSTVDCQQAQFACFWRYYRTHGLDLGMWQAQFSSRQVVPQRICNPPFWRIDKPGRRYYMSAFHESPSNMRAYYDVIRENRFPWISGYPSLMVLLAQWMNERGLSFDFVKAVTCGAENLVEHQVDAMERAFGVRPVQTYGQTENVAIFSQAPDGKILVDEDFSVVEWHPEAERGFRVVGSCLFNYATPLLRYDTGDIVQLGDQTGPRREVASIDGRCEDYVHMPDGTKIGKLDHVFKDTPHFQEAQIYQATDYSLRLRVVGEPRLCVEDEKTALAALRASIGSDLPVRFEYLSELPRSRSRKLRFVISDVVTNE